MNERNQGLRKLGEPLLWSIAAVVLVGVVLYVEILNTVQLSHPLVSVSLVLFSSLFAGRWATPVVAVIVTMLSLHDIYVSSYDVELYEHRADIYLGLAIIWVAATLVQYRKRGEREREGANHRARLRQSAVVALATDPSITAGDINATARLATEFLSDHLVVARASVWFLSSDRSELRCIDLYESPAGKHSSGIVLKAKDYPRYFAALETGRAIDANDARTDPRTSEYTEGYLIPLGITSMLDAGIRVGGRNFGVVCCEQVGPAREWGADELAFAGEIADQIAQALVNEENRRAHEAVRSNERKYRDLVETSNDLIWSIDAESRWTFVNRGAAERMFGYSPQELIGRPIFDFQTKGQARRDTAVFERVRRGDPLFFHETVFLKKDGDPVNLSFNALALRNESGQVVGITGTATDVTARLEAENKRRALEEQLRHARHLESLGRLAGGIAHDFNNLLGAILMNAELLRDGGEQTGSGSADSIVKAAQRGKSLVSQILAFSRQVERQEQRIDLGALVREIDQLVRVTLPQNITFTVNISGDVFVTGDSGQLSQVIMNLCTNAVYAMKETGGELRVDVGSIPTGFVGRERISRVKGVGNEVVMLRVSDTGSGIPESVRERIFEPFFSTKPVGEGTGLGLSVVLGIVETHGGQIHLESTAGSGTVFELYFPVASGAAFPIEPVASTEVSRKAYGTEHIVLVDDETMVLEVSAAALQQLGYKVSAFSDPEKVVQLIDRGEFAGDILVTDLTMPRFTGMELADRVVRASPGCPIILCSGYDLTRHEPNSQSPLIAKHLSKPYSVDELSQAVRSVLDARSRATSTTAMNS